MNKKFSTLVAALLVAGAWTTLDARVIEVPAPKVGGSYLIGSAVNPGDGTAGTVANLLQPTNGQATADVAAAVQTYGNEWTLEAVPAADFASDDVAGWFYLKSGDNYLIASTTANQLAVDAAKTYAVPFKLVGGKFIVAKAVTNTAITDKDKELKLAATSATTVVAAAGGTELEFGQYLADKEVAFAGQTKAALANYEEGVYYFIGAQDGKLIGFADDANAATGTVTANGATGTAIANVDQYLWKIEKTVKSDGAITYSFKNKKFDTYAKVGNSSDLVANQAYNSGFSLSVGGKALDADFAQTANMTAQVAFGIYPAANIVATVDALNKLQNGSFSLSFKGGKDGKLEVTGTDAFAGKLVAQDPAGADGYQIMSGDNYLVLDITKTPANSANAKGTFVLVSDVELAGANAANYYSYFQILTSAGKATMAEVAELKVAAANDMAAAKYAYVPYTKTTAVLSSLTAAQYADLAENYFNVSLSSSSMVEVKDLLGHFMSFTFVSDEDEAAKDVVYKKNGILATAQYAGDTDPKADYIDRSIALANAPEVQWAVVDVDPATNAVTLQNRESGKKLAGVSFFKTDEENVWQFVVANAYNTINNDIVRVKHFDNADITMFDGYRTATPNELRNQKFYIGQYHYETANATGYWAENHQGKGTHQLGVIADKDEAGEWVLSLDQKTNAQGVEQNEVDTVFVETVFYTVDANGNKVTDTKKQQKSLLAILPYQFQNKANLEYVKYADGANLNYYVCHDVADQRTDDRFALKAKPNGFSIVTLPARQNNTKATVNFADQSVVKADNSKQWGALEREDAYVPVDNSIMVVEEVAAPEYRKVVKEWGDTVRIYRQEYPTEVLFEKRDAKSVVDNDTLSFLNINNSVTGANPAIFVDTAYVNRVDADGVANTCYQYLLAVNVDKENSVYCPYNPEHNTDAWREEHGGPCADAKENPAAVKGRFLINLIDTAYAYKQEHLHNNPYINMVEADENLAKLSFVEGIHTQDTLYITRKGGEVVKLAMDSSAFNVAKFAFRYVDNEAGSFKIQTQTKNYDAANLDAFNKSANNEGYLRWVNGTIVVTNSFTNGETFNMEEGYAGNPTANENAPEVAGISVVATNGAVIVKGAEGKNVVITNVLGQQVANTTITSSEATIAAPAGIVVVAVEGEAAVKAIVK